MKEKITIEYNGKKVKIPFIKCEECENLWSTCKKCLKKSFEEACINAGQAKLLMGGEWIDDGNKDLKTNQ